MKNQTGRLEEREKGSRPRVLDCRGPSMLHSPIRNNERVNFSSLSTCPTLSLSLSLCLSVSLSLSFHSLSAGFMCQWHAEARRRIFPPFFVFVKILSFLFFSSSIEKISTRGGGLPIFRFSGTRILRLIKRKERIARSVFFESSFFFFLSFFCFSLEPRSPVSRPSPPLSLYTFLCDGTKWEKDFSSNFYRDIDRAKMDL